MAVPKQDAGFLVYYQMTGEEPVDLSTIRTRLLPGATQARLLCPAPALLLSCMRAGMPPSHVHHGI